jgi:hypothetical protein
VAITSLTKRGGWDNKVAAEIGGFLAGWPATVSAELVFWPRIGCEMLASIDWKPLQETVGPVWWLRLPRMNGRPWIVSEAADDDEDSDDKEEAEEEEKRDDDDDDDFDDADTGAAEPIETLEDFDEDDFDDDFDDDFEEEWEDEIEDDVSESDLETSDDEPDDFEE